MEKKVNRAATLTRPVLNGYRDRYMARNYPARLNKPIPTLLPFFSVDLREQENN